MTRDGRAAELVTRPALHFTARHGWINDPLGLTFHEGRYHLFYQSVPSAQEWRPTCEWGHASSDDLLRWQEHPPALAPGDGEVGCWSGCLVVSPQDDSAVIFYTSVAEENVDMGQVRTARPRDRRWLEWSRGEAVAAFPPALVGRAFRDPFVFRDGATWRMLVGAGLRDGTACVLGYRSTDLHAWTYDALLAQRSADQADPVWTGTVWECPQLVRFGDKDALVVSVCDEHGLHDVAVAVGRYAEGRFHADRWQRLTSGTPYAASLFIDRNGLPGLIMWLREVEDPARTWVGALSVPLRLALDGDRLLVEPHPNLLARRRPPGSGTDLALDVEWSPPAGRAATLYLREEGASPLVRLTSDGSEVTVLTEDDRSATVPLGARPVRVLVDGPVLEVVTDEGFAALPLSAARRTVTPEVDDADAGLRWWALDGRGEPPP